MSSFLARSLRRTIHAQLEENIIKNLSAGQDLDYVMAFFSPPSHPPISNLFFFYVKDWTWEDLREADSFIEDNEDTEEEKVLGPQSFDEKQAFANEFAVHLSPTKLV